MRKLIACLVLLALVVGPARGAPRDDLLLPLDAPDARWAGAKPIVDGACGGAASFDDPSARIDAGACPVSSSEPFTLRAFLRTRESGFCTPLMARDGDRVGLSLVMGRAPGHVSFEAWSWQSVRLISRTRIDDGKWHEIEVPYDPASGLAMLFVDGRFEGAASLGDGASPGAMLRLGNNIGADQPYRGDVDDVAVLRRTTHADVFAALEPVVPASRSEAHLAALRTRLFPKRTPSFDDLPKWPARRDEVRRNLADSIGLAPLPARGPLEPKIHGEIKGEGFRVQRLSWNSWPGERTPYRATGWLWLPDPMPPGRRPAMLGPHGHWSGGAIDPVVQSRAIRFARVGYVGLMVDSVHIEDTAAGVSAIGVMTWNNMRAIDVLTARDDVDPARIGCTGASGGGQQTMVLMALDDRIAAAAPIVMACYFAALFATEGPNRGPHCMCNYAPRIACVTDVPEMCGVFAPKPALFGTVTGDWTHRFPREGFPELRRLYDALGHRDRVSNHHRNEEHNYDRPFREAVYAFFDEQFGLELPADEGAIVTLPLSELRALGPQGGPPDRRTLAREHVARRPRFADLSMAAPGIPWTAGKAPLADVGMRGPWRAATVADADGIEVPVLMRDSSPGGDGAWTVVRSEHPMSTLVVDPPAWFSGVPRLALVESRDLLGLGHRDGILVGRGDGYAAAHDLARVAESLPGRGSVTVVGIESAGVEALLAASMSARIGTVIVPELGDRFEVRGERDPQCPEILRFGDLPEIVGALRGRRRVVLGGAAGPSDYRAFDGVYVTASVAPLTADEVEKALGGK